MNIEKLEEKRTEKGLSIKQVADEAKIGYATAYDVFKGKTVNPKLATIQKIIKVLNLDITEVI